MSENEREISNEMRKKLAPMIKISEAINNREILPIIDLQKSRDDLLKENNKQLKKLNKKSKKITPIETIEFTNPFEAIFASSKSYQLFDKLHQSYRKEEKTYLANYSYIFNAMEKDGYIICTRKNYINFLNDTFQITIDKIDSRQNGETNKTKLYEAFKALIFIQAQ
jgi:hypothetical protein